MATIITPASGLTITATRHAELNNEISNAPRHITGLDISTASGLDVSVAAGVAIVAGYRIDIDAATTVTLADDDTNYVWLESDGTVSDNVTGTAPTTGALLLGTVLTASGSVSSISHYNDATHGGYVRVVKPSDETVSSSVTMQSDDHLLFAVLPRESWEITILAELSFVSNGGFKHRLFLPSGKGIATLSIDEFGAIHQSRIYQADSHSSSVRFAASGDGRDNTSSIGYASLHAILTVGDVGGNIQYEWAQNTASGSTTVKAGSVLQARRLPA